MNKKLKYLSIIPLYGTCILFIYLFLLSMKEKISRKKFFKAFIICASVSAICWYMVMMIVYILSKKLICFDFIHLGLPITIVIGGYMMNAFAFKYIGKKWNYLSSDDVKEEKSFLEANKKKIILIAFVLAIIITFLTLATILTLELI